MEKINLSEFMTPSAIDQWHETHEDRSPRPYMGISMIGHKCDRYLWLMYRWAVREKFSGRMLRLFRRGQLEEQQITDDLKRIGCIVTHTGDDQYEVDFGGNVRGHLDGIIESGLPEAPKKRHVLECKTHSDKSFQELRKKGVAEAKPMHWAQMQCYMLGLGTDRALYFAVNKNDDEIYTERVHLDKEAAELLITRAKNIAADIFMPLGISNDATWWECKLCPCWDVCHGTHKTQETNCRTCRHCEPDENGNMKCVRLGFPGVEIPYEIQVKACRNYVVRPDLRGET